MQSTDSPWLTRLDQDAPHNSDTYKLASAPKIPFKKEESLAELKLRAWLLSKVAVECLTVQQSTAWPIIDNLSQYILNAHVAQMWSYNSVTDVVIWDL